MVGEGIITIKIKHNFGVMKMQSHNDNTGESVIVGQRRGCMVIGKVIRLLNREKGNGWKMIQLEVRL